MRIFERNRPAIRQQQVGLTLLELLITLSILSLAAGVTVSAINARSPRYAVHQTAEQLVTDLKRARLEAQKTGKAVSVRFADNQYEVSAWELQRTPPHGVSIRLSGADQDVIAFSSVFAHLGGEVRIEKGNASAVVIVRPITGKVARID